MGSGLNTKCFSVGALFVALVIASPASATDHLDSQRITLDPSSDLTDFFIFVPTKDRLVLAMNVVTGAGLNTRFSDVVKYQFHLHPFTSPGDILAAKPNPDKTVLVECQFSMPDAKNVQAGTCSQKLTANGSTSELAGSVTFTVGEFRKGKTYSIGAGIREDSFVLNGPCAFGFDPRCQRKSDVPDQFEGLGIKNSINKLNMLAIVVELDRNLVVNKLGSNLLAAFGTTRLKSATGNGKIIDRIGRPEMTNFMLRDDYPKFPYNQEDTLNIKKSPFLKEYLGRITEGIFILDSRDQVNPADKTQFDWQGDDLAKLQNLLLFDYLTIDTSKITEQAKRPKSGFFSIELELINRSSTDLQNELNSAGGRAPQEDAIDAHVTFLTNGPKKKVLRQDGVASSDLPKSFPFYNAAKADSFIGVPK